MPAVGQVMRLLVSQKNFTSLAHSSLLDLEQWLHSVGNCVWDGPYSVIYLNAQTLIHFYFTNTFLLLNLSRFSHLPAAAFLHYIPSSSIRIVNNREFLELDALFFQQVYTKLQMQKLLIVAEVGNLLARRRRKGTGGRLKKTTVIYTKMAYRKFLCIFPHFWQFFRGQIHLSTRQGENFYVRYTIHPNMGQKS
jgi:hypothetical protein